ncbi:MAG TPA: response regulator transcription factor [Gammaproteobacteria bacterium]|nr:response regulator transcription factor [Gammaproteobacteria bacterium]
MNQASEKEQGIVYVVDDDRGVRDSLNLLLGSAGIVSEAFESAAAFLAGFRPDRIGCLVADIRMPGMSGLELQQELNARKVEIPIVFITGHGDVPMAVNAMKAGAVDFLTKPFRNRDLLDRIEAALGSARAGFQDHEKLREARARYAALTPREAEVMELVVSGLANKVIAMDLGVSQRTVELHRARVMQKMGVRSLAELVRLAESLK